MRLRIEYGDKNEGIAARFPLAGEVESTPRCADSALAWHLVRLDASIHDRGTQYSHLLIASRWRGRRVGDHSSVSVFLLGSILILRGMSLGIPYLSPDLSAAACCHR